MNIPADVLHISNLYKKAGKELFIVGGSVRDFIRGIEPKDFDLATNATPDESIQILKKHFVIKEVGKAFGVIVAICDQFPDGIEVATFRKDIGTGRRPDSVEFTTIESDVLRRDLTINSLFYNIEEKRVVDLVGGLEDLENKIIRTVGDPDERFSDDPLRRLRSIRFLSDLEGTFDESLENSLLNNNDISSVSAERIKDEFVKIINKTKNIRKSIDVLDNYGFLQQIFPGLKIKTDLLSKNLLSLVALMLKDNIEPMSEENLYPFKNLQKTLNELRWNIDEISSISYLIRLRELSPNTGYNLKRQRRRCKIEDETIEDFLVTIGKPRDLIDSFFKYQIITDPEKIMAQGYKNEDVGKEMERIETIRFYELIRNQI